MGAAQNDGVYLWIDAQKVVDVFLYEIVGSGGVGFMVLDQRHPHRTGLACDLDVGVELGNLQFVGAAGYGALGGHDTYVAGAGERTHTFGCGADDTEHAAGGVVHVGQVVLLYAAQGFGAGCVTPEDYEGAAHRKEFANGLKCEFINYLEGARAVWRPRVVSEIEIVVFRHQLPNLVQDGQASVARIKDAERRH